MLIIAVNRFKVIKGEIFKPPPLSNLEWPAIFGAMGLGFCLSLLIFMDHNIAGAMVNSPDNGLVTCQTIRRHSRHDDYLPVLYY